MNEIKEISRFDDSAGKMVVCRSQDVSQAIAENKALRNASPETGAYMGKDLVHVASIPEIVVEMLYRGQCCTDGKRYNLLSTDPDEQRRAYLHIQSEHPDLLVIRGKPFAKKRATWE